MGRGLLSTVWILTASIASYYYETFMTTYCNVNKEIKGRVGGTLG